MYRQIGIFLLLLLALGLFSAQRYRTKSVTYKYPYSHGFAGSVNSRVTFAGDIGPHEWFRMAGTDTVSIWYFIGGDSTEFLFPPHTLGVNRVKFDVLGIAGGDKGGVRVKKGTTTIVYLWGVTNRK
jgi:hypothetical protein